mgnify:CR=1 FL=1
MISQNECKTPSYVCDMSFYNPPISELLVDEQFRIALRTLEVVKQHDYDKATSIAYMILADFGYVVPQLFEDKKFFKSTFRLAHESLDEAKKCRRALLYFPKGVAYDKIESKMNRALQGYNFALNLRKRVWGERKDFAKHELDKADRA